MIVLDIERQENLVEDLVAIFDLRKVLSVVIVFLAILIMLYRMKCQLVRLLNLAHLEYRCVLPNMGDVL